MSKLLHNLALKSHVTKIFQPATIAHLCHVKIQGLGIISSFWLVTVYSVSQCITYYVKKLFSYSKSMTIAYWIWKSLKT